MTEVDPISLEPLGTLKYPPFEIIGKDGHKHFFDGQCLASYMVGTSSFFNPLSREPISSRVCQRLDIYLQKNKLKQLRVLEAFNLNKNVVGKDSNGSQVGINEKGYCIVSCSALVDIDLQIEVIENGNNYQGNINNTTTNAGTIVILIQEKEKHHMIQLEVFECLMMTIWKLVQLIFNKIFLR